VSLGLVRQLDLTLLPQAVRRSASVAALQNLQVEVVGTTHGAMTPSEAAAGWSPRSPSSCDGRRLADHQGSTRTGRISAPAEGKSRDKSEQQHGRARLRQSYERRSHPGKVPLEVVDERPIEEAPHIITVLHGSFHLQVKSARPSSCITCIPLAPASREASSQHFSDSAVSCGVFIAS